MEKYMMIGSIISSADKNTTVWGSGIISSKVKVCPDSTYLSVRGPITYEIVKQQGGKAPPIFGDPALICPKIHFPKCTKKYEIGIMPHYVDYEQCVKSFSKLKNVKIINILNSNPFMVIDEILKCKRIVTSSLHGIIVCNAYGVPVSWVKLSDKLVGDSSKFFDHFESINSKKHTCSRIDNTDNITYEDLQKLTYTTVDPDIINKTSEDLISVLANNLTRKGILND